MYLALILSKSRSIKFGNREQKVQTMGVFKKTEQPIRMIQAKNIFLDSFLGEADPAF